MTDFTRTMKGAFKLLKLDLDQNATWKQRFRATSILWAKTANLNPERGLVCTDRDGTLQLYAWDTQSGRLNRLTNLTAGVVVGAISADGESVYYMEDEKGNETGHFVRIPFAGGPVEDLTPDIPPYGSFQISQSFCGNLLGTRAADSSGQTLYVFAPGEPPRRIHKTSHGFEGPSISYGGEIAVISTTEGSRSSDTRLMAFDLTSGALLAELWDGKGTSHGLGDFSPLPGDFRILSTTSKTGYSRPIIWNPRSGERRDLAIDEIPGEVNAWAWSNNANDVLLSQFNHAEHQLYLYHLETDRVTKLDHPKGVLGSFFDRGFFSGKSEIFITCQNLTRSPRLVALDASTGRELYTVLETEKEIAGRSWESIVFTGANDQPIQAWLAVPEGDGPFPTIVHIHGGPRTVMADNYSPEIQAWLDHGLAFFSINYHGSTTFGQKFEKSILGRPGELEVQDIAAGYQWLIEKAIAKPGSVFITGESYGGYLTLMAISQHPDLWAGGMAGVAIADWVMMYEDENEALRGYHRILFGGSPEETMRQHEKSSPIHYAVQIQAPLLVIQGKNDTRCPPRQMKAYEEKMKSLGKQIEVFWFDAGHGSRAREQRLENQQIRMRFVHNLMKSGLKG